MKDTVKRFRERYDKLIDKHTVAYTKTGDEDFNPPEVISFDIRVINNFELGNDLEAFILTECERVREETIKEVEKIIEPKAAMRIGNINEKYFGDRDCKLCGQNPERWCNQLLSQLKGGK